MTRVNRKKLETDQGWSWFVLLAAFYCSVTFDGIIYSFGVFYLELLDYFQESRSRTAWIVSVISGMYSLVGPLASILANKFGCRWVTMFGALLACVGFVLSTFSVNVFTMICTFSVMGGIGFGLMYLCAYVMIGHYFEKYRALATGIASCGSGFGTFLFAPLTVLLIEQFSWKGAMWIMAGIVLNGVVMGALFRPFPPQITDESGGEKSLPLIDLKLLVNPVFILLCSSGFLCMIGFFIPFIYLPDYARYIGLSRSEGAILLSIIGATNTVGRIICGFISDKSWADPLIIHNTALILGGVATICVCWIPNFPVLCIYAAVFGTCIAAYVSQTTIVLVELLGLDKLCSSFGLLNLFRGISTFIGAPLAGFLFDVGGQYDIPFYTAGGVIVCAGLLCLPIRLVQRSQCSRSQHTSNNTQLSREKKPLNEKPGQHPELYPNMLDKHKQRLLNDKGLYSSTLSLSGSQISISVPNPYVSKGNLSMNSGSNENLSCGKGSRVNLSNYQPNAANLERKLHQSNSCQSS